MPLTTKLAVSGAIVLCTAAVGCGSDDSSSSDTTSDTTTQTTATQPPATTATTAPAAATALTGDLSEWAIKTDVPSVAAGDVKVTADNVGKIEHELVFIKTDLAADDLPVVKGRVDEKKAGTAEGEVEDVAPGAKKNITAKLPAGHYALICNYPGHYEQGMHTDLTVGG